MPNKRLGCQIIHALEKDTFVELHSNTDQINLIAAHLQLVSFICIAVEQIKTQILERVESLEGVETSAEKLNEAASSDEARSVSSSGVPRYDHFRLTSQWI